MRAFDSLRLVDDGPDADLPEGVGGGGLKTAGFVPLLSHRSSVKLP